MALPAINPLETSPSVILTDAAPPPAMPTAQSVASFAGLERDAIIALLRTAIEAHRINLYLQPIVTLPQRKVRYYEALSRLKTESDEIVAAADFLPYAEAGSLMPKLDGLSVLRCVQVVRRLLLKNRDIGLFCNLSGASLTDPEFPQLLELLEANRAIASALVFEFTQSAVRAMGPLDHESLAALAERGFRFSMDNLSDLRVDPRELNERGFRFIKASAALLLNRVGAASTDIHPADFSDLLGRFGIDLVAERIESESTVVDLLDYDVRFGQGFLFSPPRPVRAEALQGGMGEATKAPPAAPAATKPQAANGTAAAPTPAAQIVPPPAQAEPASDAPFAAVSGALAEFVRAGDGRG
jgi:cyclic-di-GMP phosphodiesterase TipF (flagellum assembly factor)